jgi:hypothetical protein
VTFLERSLQCLSARHGAPPRGKRVRNGSGDADRDVNNTAGLQSCHLASVLVAKARRAALLILHCNMAFEAHAIYHARQQLNPHPLPPPMPAGVFCHHSIHSGRVALAIAVRRAAAAERGGSLLTAALPRKRAVCRSPWPNRDSNPGSLARIAS